MSQAARRAGHNKFGEREPAWRDVWTVVKFEKSYLQTGEWQTKIRHVSQPAEFVNEVHWQRLKKNPAHVELRKPETCQQRENWRLIFEVIAC